jgi:hypothetical protein
MKPRKIKATAPRKAPNPPKLPRSAPMKVAAELLKAGKRA